MNSITFEDIMTNHALSPVSVWHLLLPFSIFKTVTSSVVSSLGGICGSGGLGQIGNAILRLIIWLTMFCLLWFAANVFVKLPLFFFASIYRLVKGVGGKQGRVTSWFHFGVYSALIVFFMVPVVLPWFLPYSGWDAVLHWMKLT